MRADLFEVNTLTVFIGRDPRQSVAVQVLAHSVFTRASGPVSIVPLILKQLPIKRVGLTEFTYSRYLPPYLTGYQGKSIFLDADMLCLGDVYELADLAGDAPVAVVKNKLRFEWPSLMVFNGERCKRLTTEYIEDPRTAPQSFDWAEEVGSLPGEWNICVGYDEPIAHPKLVHYTQGIPCFEETKDCPYAEEWVNEARASMSTVDWAEIMGNSVHAKAVLKRLGKWTSPE